MTFKEQLKKKIERYDKEIKNKENIVAIKAYYEGRRDMLEELIDMIGGVE